MSTGLNQQKNRVFRSRNRERMAVTVVMLFWPSFERCKIATQRAAWPARFFRFRNAVPCVPDSFTKTKGAARWATSLAGAGSFCKRPLMITIDDFERIAEAPLQTWPGALLLTVIGLMLAFGAHRVGGRIEGGCAYLGRPARCPELRTEGPVRAVDRRAGVSSGHIRAATPEGPNGEERRVSRRTRHGSAAENVSRP